jgi:hypothetical protein
MIFLCVKLAITIPSSNTSTYTNAKIIPAGQPVILLKTSKGTYLRTPDGKFYAIRNPSMNSSPSITSTSFQNNVNDDDINNSSFTSKKNIILNAKLIFTFFFLLQFKQYYLKIN